MKRPKPYIRIELKKETTETVFEIPAKLGCNLANVLRREDTAELVDDALYHGYTITIKHEVN
jgi:hypothetical protein